MAEYQLSPAAEFDLETIWEYTLKRWGDEQASRYIDQLVAEFAELAQFPMAAPACDYIRPGYRRSRMERHIIYFRITSYGIAIVRVLHERMDVYAYLPK